MPAWVRAATSATSSALGAGRGMEDELTVLVANVDAIEGEGVEVRIDPERAVAALDDRQRAHERVLDAA